ncbi:unnamed protein product [Haemonchus placei]|uniref:YDG domain-containing protein n=1 Tax=Haemonchus placei TaxID=6290 RepID=A0A0N4W540_HAEPC|nr:unnamed protein product [Haemonchus placei]
MRKSKRDRASNVEERLEDGPNGRCKAQNDGDRLNGEYAVNKGDNMHRTGIDGPKLTYVCGEIRESKPYTGDPNLF